MGIGGQPLTTETVKDLAAGRLPNQLRGAIRQGQ
jgi:hypothetical protein